MTDSRENLRSTAAASRRIFLRALRGAYRTPRRVLRGIRARRFAAAIAAAEAASRNSDWDDAIARWQAIATRWGAEGTIRAAAPSSTALRVRGRIDAAEAVVATASSLPGAATDLPIMFEKAALALTRHDAPAALRGLEELRALIPPGHPLEFSALVMHASAIRMTGASSRTVYRPEELRRQSFADSTPSVLEAERNSRLDATCIRDGLTIVVVRGQGIIAAQDESRLRATRESIEEVVPGVEVLEASFDRLAETASSARGRYLLLLEPGDLVREGLRSVVAIAGAQDLSAVIADETWPGGLEGGDSSVPSLILKPAWDIDLVLTRPAYGRMVLIRREVFAGPVHPVDDLVLEGEGVSGAVTALNWYALLSIRAAQGVDGVVHVPVIGLDVGARPPNDLASRARAKVERHLVALGEHAGRRPTVEAVGPTAPLRIRWPSDPSMVVSVVIPTRDRADLLARCVRSVLETSQGQPVEFVIVDNGSVEPATHQLFEELASVGSVEVIGRPGDFNFSFLINEGVRASSGQMVIVMNNDVVATHPGWLQELTGQASRPEVGMVGPMLLYEDGSVQHAGIATGINGLVDHVLRSWPSDDPGPDGVLASTRRVAAVTGACMALRRDVFEALGGFDERSLPVEMSDVDLCLRAWSTGLSVVFTPHARLKHLEGATRSSRRTQESVTAEIEQRAIFAERWAGSLGEDPAYHPRLSRSEPTYLLAPHTSERASPVRPRHPWRAPSGEVPVQS